MRTPSCHHDLYDLKIQETHGPSLQCIYVYSLIWLYRGTRHDTVSKQSEKVKNLSCSSFTLSMISQCFSMFFWGSHIESTLRRKPRLWWLRCLEAHLKWSQQQTARRVFGNMGIVISKNLGRIHCFRDTSMIYSDYLLINIWGRSYMIIYDHIRSYKII